MKDAVELEVTEMLRTREAIENAEAVQSKVLAKHDLEVSVPIIRATMKKQLCMSYHTAKKVPKQGNTERCLVLRQ